MFRGKIDALGSPINVFLEIGIHLPSFLTADLGFFQHPRLYATVDTWSHCSLGESWPTSRYSIRNAWVGLMEAARRAGIQAAINATRTSMAGTSVNVTASCGLMP